MRQKKAAKGTGILARVFGKRGRKSGSDGHNVFERLARANEWHKRLLTAKDPFKGVSLHPDKMDRISLAFGVSLEPRNIRLSNGRMETIYRLVSDNRAKEGHFIEAMKKAKRFGINIKIRNDFKDKKTRYTASLRDVSLALIENSRTYSYGADGSRTASLHEMTRMLTRAESEAYERLFNRQAARTIGLTQ